MQEDRAAKSRLFVFLRAGHGPKGHCQDRQDAALKGLSSTVHYGAGAKVPTVWAALATSLPGPLAICLFRCLAAISGPLAAT